MSSEGPGTRGFAAYVSYRRFGLCELRGEEPGDLPYLPRTRWRKSHLFDRFLRFRV